MKFLHTSDWHLGIGLGHQSLASMQAQMIDAIGSLCQSENVEVVLLSGDVYDRMNPNQEAIQLYTMAMKKLCIEQNLNVCVIAGNHDHSTFLMNCNDLLAASGLYVSGRIAEQKRVVIQDICIHFFPFHHHSEVRRMFPDETIHSYDDAMRIVAQDSLKKASIEYPNCTKHVALSHCFLSGGSLSGSEEMAQLSIGHLKQISADCFMGFDYVALGHLHAPQVIGSNIVYSGTPAKFQFSEWHQKKGVYIWDSETDVLTFHPISLSIDLFELEARYEDLIEFSPADFKHYVCKCYQTNNADMPQSLDQLFLRIKLLDERPTLDRLNVLKSLHPHILELADGRPHLRDTQHRYQFDLFEAMHQRTPLDWLVLFMKSESNEPMTDEMKHWFIEAIEEQEHAQ